MVYRLY